MGGKRMKGMSVIRALTGLLLPSKDPRSLEFITHCIGLETGIRLAVRHPEYTQLVLRRIDRETDRGKLYAEKAIDALVEAQPLEEVAHG